MPLAPTALSGQIANDRPRAPDPVRLLPTIGRPRRRIGRDESASTAGFVTVDTELAQGFYDHGIHARRNARTHLEDVTDLLDGIEYEVDWLLAFLDTPEHGT
ncbi:hypothetical protein FXW78_50795 [Rhodococcus opacus]|nr:hypothetical protein [Rhodococcus opacus]RZL82405.1 MAG: hypothetical protein EOP32_11600 [Rhodococcus sp. (in: high G+C Gram-positive bacteria)]